VIRIPLSSGAAIACWLIVLAGMPIPARARTGTEDPGSLSGEVRDKGTGQPVAGAVVRLLEGGVGAAEADDRGRFVLSCPAGTVQIRVTADGYRPRRVRGIRVEPGRRTGVQVMLEPEPLAVLEVVVSARADLRTEGALLQARMRSGSVSDAVSSEEMSRAPDSAASDAVKRVVATTLIDGRYAAIRGLGGRYTSLLLNRVNLPSPDPDEVSFPIDLLPASLLSNLSVTKTHTAEMPANFGGGTLGIETNSFPETLEVKAKLGLGMRSDSTFRSMPTYRGGKADFLGYDDGSRGLPGTLPEGIPAASFVPGMDGATMEAIGESFRNEWESSRRRAWPHVDLGLTVGDTVPLGTTRLGYLLSANYSHRDHVRRSRTIKVALDDDGTGLRVRDEAEVLRGAENARIGVLVDLGLRIDASHALEVLSLYLHDADKVAEAAAGYNETDGQDFESGRLQFIARTLSFSQLRGLHRFPGARNLELEWSGDVSLVIRDEPDTRDIKHQVLEDGRRRFSMGPGSGERRFTRLRDLALGGRIEAMLPLPAIHLRLGGAVQHSSRDLDSRRFRYQFVGQDPSVLFLPPSEMLGPESVGPNFRIEERTSNADAYQASLLVASAWVSGQILASEPVHLLPGLRMEYARQSLESGTPYSVVDQGEPGVHRDDLSFVPSLNARWAIRKDMNLRAAYGWTLARPQFRELAPFAYYDFTRRRTVSGNPGLDLTRIHGADLRWEWFPKGSDGVLAASVFYKHFDAPIERVILTASQGDVGYQNAPRAWLTGGELEVRTSLGVLWKGLREFRLWANAAVIASRVGFRSDQATLQTSRRRPLQGQSPWVVNVGLGWTGRASGTEVHLLYNAFGRRITEVGFDRLPDIHEEPVHRLDLTVSQRLGHGFRVRLALANLAYQPVLARQGDVTVFRYQPGISGSLSVDWSFGQGNRGGSAAEESTGGTP